MIVLVSKKPISASFDIRSDIRSDIRADIVTKVLGRISQNEARNGEAECSNML